MRTVRALAAFTLGLGLTLSACGDDEGAMNHDASALQTAGNGDVFNNADVEFATHMIPHHAQAIQMVVMTQGRPLDPEIEQLANDIRAAQVPEVETMTDWLTGWDKEVPETSLDHANAGHDMDEMTPMEGMDDVPGMMTAEEMEALMNASDEEFQGMWLEMMIKHHEGAIEISEKEEADGHFDPAIQLAADIKTAQEAELATMQGLLADL